MWPTLFEVQTPTGPVGAHTYGLLVLTAFCVALGMVHVRAARIGMNPDRMLPAYIATGVGAFIGARLLYAVAVDGIARILENPLTLFQGAGFAYYGGVMGGSVAVFACAGLLRLDAWKLLDIIAAALAMGLGIGRMACFFAGCCHGAEADVGLTPFGLLPPGILDGQLWLSTTFPFLTTEFHGGVGRLHDLPLYPTQLWSAVGGITIGSVLWFTWKKRRFDGQAAGIHLIVEPLVRFTVESFRADERGYAFSFPVSESVASWLPPGFAAAGEKLGYQAGTAVIGLTTSQAIGLAMIIIGVTILVVRRNAGVKPEIPIKGWETEEDEDAEPTSHPAA